MANDQQRAGVFHWLDAEKSLRLCAWVFVLAVIVYSVWRIAGFGLAIRQDFWVYWASNRFSGDMNSALEHGDMVLREAESIAQDDQQQETPQQRQAEEEQIAAGHRLATVARPGPGLFDSPLDRQTFLDRWHRLKPIYGQILRGWVQTYEHLYRDQGPDGNFDMDYPPMRLLVMSLWTWSVQTNYPGITRYPESPQRVFDPDRNQNIVATMDVVQPVLKFNTVCEGVTAIAIFILVWLWMERRPVTLANSATSSWRARWGDPMLLAPVVVFAIFILIRPHLSWHMPVQENIGESQIDRRVTSISWWISFFLRFISVICLARFLPRPYRAPMCALVAGTIAWMNPASLPDSFGWPQWDCWLPPFFLVAAVLVTINWWVAAGIMLGVGCMFKGQLLFVSPVLVLCPLLAGWPGRFFRIVTGLVAGAGLIIWPWLVTNPSAVRWIFLAFTTAAFFCALSATRGFLWRQGRATWQQLSSDLPLLLTRTILFAAAALLLSLGCFFFTLVVRHGTPAIIALFAISIFLVPWFLPRRLLAGWLLFAFAAPLWLAGSYGNGSRTWWDIGFVYGTQRHKDMQLGANSLSNLSSLLHERYGWQLHDHVTSLDIAMFGSKGFDLDMQAFCGLIFGGALLLCSIAAAIHMRRKDPRFLIVLVAPWVLFTILLTQMTARYTTLPAVIGSLLIGVSAELSLLTFLQAVLACAMLGNQSIVGNSDMAPITASITQPTYPDLGWLTVLLATVFLVSALIPSQKWRRPVEVI